MTIQEYNTQGDQATTPAITTDNSTIRIYVACLAAYNNGVLHGAWIDAQQDADALQWAIWDMLKTSPIEGAEEWAIHDYEGFEGAPISEYTGMEEIAALAAFIGEHGALGGELIGHFCGNLNEARTAIEDSYAGEYTSLSDFAQEMTEERGDIPEHLAFYIDYDAMARDMEINDVFTVETGFEEIHVFWAR